MLPARHRLVDAADFAAAVRGARASTDVLTVHVHASDARRLLPVRIGFVVSKNVGNAVVRNRVKRRLRAGIATLLPTLSPGLDVVVRAHASAARAGTPQLWEAQALALGKAEERFRRRQGASAEAMASPPAARNAER